MSDYKERYYQRVNRYGDTHQSRIQTMREKNFEHMLARSAQAVTVETDNEDIRGIFTRFRQGDSISLHYFLTKREVQLDSGTILDIPTKVDSEETHPWMVYYPEYIYASGYTRHIMLRMTHTLEWVGQDGETYTSPAYVYGQEDNMLKNEVLGRSRMGTLYRENLKLSFFVMPTTPNLRKDDYLIITEGGFQEQYRVTGYDIQSQVGVMYVSADPTYKYNESAKTVPEPGEESDDFFWLTGQGAKDEG